MSSGRHEALTVEADEIRLRYLKAEIELGLKFARISIVENDLDFVSANRLKQAAVRASTIVHRFMSLIANSPEKHDLKQRLSELDRLLSTLQIRTAK